MRTVPKGALIASVIISVLILLVWMLQVASLSGLGHSDAAGNGMAQGFTALEIILLWVLLAILLLVTGVAGRMPWPAAVAAVVLLPASGVAAMSALDLLADNDTPPYLWPIITPALVPPIIVFFGFWTLLPALRAAIPATIASGVAWGTIALLCVALVPMVQIRDRANEQGAAARAQWAENFDRLAPNAPLWDLTPFLATPNDTRQEVVLARIRQINQRQAQAYVMLDRGDFPLRSLGSLNLDPTPDLCDKARALLRRHVQTLMPKTAGKRPYADVADDVAGALAAMQWLVGYGCSCDAEAFAWEAMAKQYRHTNFDVFELAQLRDPKALGYKLLQAPDRFSQLTPEAHLRAWLRFARDKETRDAALDGARRLEHRTPDAVEMLNQDKYEVTTVLTYLPVLDLQTTELLCAASLKALHGQMAQIYRPRPDDPEPYDQLLSRLGTASPLSALQWLAVHGCDADGMLDEAAALVGTYQDSPDRSAQLANLARLHRKS
jgi:hypothetical protein